MTNDEIERAVATADGYLEGSVLGADVDKLIICRALVALHERESLCEVEAMAQRFYEAVANGSWADTMKAEILKCGGPVKYSFALAEAFYSERDRRRERAK